mmetsp:Transcript_59466/g.159259  ORF Transcript_59466/g.159259 Transcript_59466/m.159259 type:complete len:819 (+) Transcript_59466:92-2548(+)
MRRDEQLGQGVPANPSREVREAVAATAGNGMPSLISARRHGLCRCHPHRLVGAEPPFQDAAIACRDEELIRRTRHGEIRCAACRHRHGNLAGRQPLVQLLAKERNARLLTLEGNRSVELPSEWVACRRSGGKGRTTQRELQAHLLARPDAILWQAEALRECAAAGCEKEARVTPRGTKHLADALHAAQRKRQGVAAKRALRLHVHEDALVPAGKGDKRAGAAGGNQRRLLLRGPVHVRSLQQLLHRHLHGRRHIRLTKAIGKRREDGNQALGLLHDFNVLLALCTHETAIATTSVAPLVARAQAGPRRHPRLHVGWPAHHTALLLQEHALAIDLLNDAADAHVHPHADAGHDGATHQLPGPECGHRILRLLGERRGLGTLGSFHLLLQARLPWLQLLWWCHDVHAILEGLGQPPLLGPPRLPGRLDLLLIWLVWASEVVHANGPSNVDAVANPGEDVDHRHPAGAWRDNAVVEGHAQHSDHRRPRHELLDLEVVCAAEAVRDNITLQDCAVGGAEDEAARPCRPDGTQLTKGVAHGVKAGTGEPMGHEEEHANPGVDVMAPPLLLQATVELEMFRCGIARGSRATLACMEVVHLVGLVPPGDLALLRSALGLLEGTFTVRTLLHIDILLRCGCDKGDAEHVGSPGPLKGVTGLACLVQLLRCRDGETDVAGEHVGSACLCACRGVHGHPVVEDQEHQCRACVAPVEAHEPARWRGTVDAQPAGHDELEVQHKENHANHMVQILFRARKGGHVTNVLAVHGCLLHGERVPCGVPSETELVVKHVVCPVVREGRCTHSTSCCCRSSSRLCIRRRSAEDAG